MAREKTNRIVVYRLIDTIIFADVDLTNKGYTLEYYEEDKKLFVQLRKESTPQWVSYLEPYIGDGIDNIVNQSSSFVLFINHENSVYALAGGYGYTALKEMYEDEFGLNVALRMINKISSVNQRSMKGVTRQLFRSVAGYEPLFDRDNYNRILKHIEGKGTFEGKTFRISGRSSLVLRTTKDINNVSDVIVEVEDILKREEKIHFPKSYKLVKDSIIIDNLTNCLFAEFKRYWEDDDSRDNIYLEFDDPLVQFRCEKYKVKYGRKSVELNEFDLDLIKQEMKGEGVQSLNDVNCLSNFKVYGENESGYLEVKNENFVHILVFETFLDNVQYIKFGKEWYEIPNEVQDFINEQLSFVKVDDSLLPECNINTYDREEYYIQHVANMHGWACFDQDFVYIEGRSKIEFCDLYDHSTKNFFYIKRTWGCKSVYLYTQAATAAESYRQSKVFKEKCANKWPEYFSDEITGGTIVIGLAAEKDKFTNFPKNMTYFAKLNLYNAIALIKQNDFNVILAPVELTNT